MLQIKHVPVAAIHENPYRDLGTYPWIEPKIAQLVASIKEVGFWVGVIARPHAKGYQMAFGHHRIEAARRAKLKEIPLVIDELTDKQMIQYMGRENGEDYAADFLVMLNTWEGALKFLDNSKAYGERAQQRAQSHQPIEIARLLGWVEIRPEPRLERRAETGAHMTHVARACWAGHALISGGHMARGDFARLTVSQAEDIATAAQERIEGLAKLGAREGHKAADTRQGQGIIGKAARETARRVGEGEVANKQIRGELDLTTLRVAGRAAKPVRTPLFAMFGHALCEQIGRMIATDSAAAKLDEIERVRDSIELEEDQAVIRKLHHELTELSHRANRRIKRTTKSSIVKLREITSDKSA